MNDELNPDAPLFAIAVAAELAAMHPQTLRQYDRLGLVSPTRTAGQSRRYSMRDVMQLREVARLSAEGVSLEGIRRILQLENQVTELSDRVRERLVNVQEGLEAFLAGADPGRDEVVQLLIQGSEGEVRQRQERLARALADFDAATIATIHSFCQEALGSLGVTGDVERGLTVVEEIDDLLVEVVDDLYVRRFHWDERPPLKRHRTSRAQ